MIEDDSRRFTSRPWVYDGHGVAPTLRRLDHNRCAVSAAVGPAGPAPFRTDGAARLMRRYAWAALALALGSVASVPTAARAQTQRKPLNPCTLVSNADVAHVLGWSVDSRRRRPYNIHGATGAMCFLAASQGQVIVIVPDPESDLPGITVYNDPAAGDLAKHVYGLGADVILYNSTVYVSGYHRDVEVRVVPDSHAASYAEVEGFGAIVATRLRQSAR